MTKEFRAWALDVVHCRRRLFNDARPTEMLLSALYELYADNYHVTVMAAAERLSDPGFDPGFVADVMASDNEDAKRLLRELRLSE